MQDDQKIVTLSAMARRLGVKSKWLRAEAQAKRLPAVEAGDTFLFDPVTVERVLMRRARQGAPIKGATP